METARESWCAALPEGHGLAKQDAVSLKELAAERLIFYARWNSPAGYDDVIEMFKEKNVTPLIYQEATEQMTIAGLVASGMGIGIVPECMSRIKIPGVVHRKIKNTKNRTGFIFLSRKEKDVFVENFFQGI